MTTILISRPRRFQYSSAALLQQQQFLNGSGNVLRTVIFDAIYGHQRNAVGSPAADLFFQLFNDVPALGNVPLVSIRVPPDATFSFAPPNGYRMPNPETPGVPNVTRPFWAISLTDPTYTAASDTFWINAQGRAVPEF